MLTRGEITVSVGGGLRIDRAGLAALIASLPGLRVVPLGQRPPPQVLVWDARTLNGRVQENNDELSSVSSHTVILLLTDNSGFESLPDTVTGLFFRDELPAALGIAIRQVARGEQYISPSLAIAMLKKRRIESSLTNSQKSVIESLTNREREILELLAQGLSNKAIAARLYLSVRTVEGHLANIYTRFGVRARTEAMLIALKMPKETLARDGGASIEAIVR